jgi:hypothetical protein
MAERKAKKENLDLLVSPSDLLMTKSPFSAEQLNRFYSKTPTDKIKQRKAKGGGTWDYVETGYVIDTLNRVFGYLWSFEVMTSIEEAAKISSSGTCVVKGRLTVYVDGHALVKEQFGRCECKKKRDSGEFLDFGNDMKGAASDALKKCASEFGLFKDVYSKDDTIDLNVVEDDEKEKILDAAIIEACDKLNKAKTIAELKTVFCALSIKIRADKAVIETKDAMKKKLSAKKKETKK